jgi:hypothetical protein
MEVDQGPNWGCSAKGKNTSGLRRNLENLSENKSKAYVENVEAPYSIQWNKAKTKIIFR